MGQVWPPRPPRILTGQESGISSSGWTIVSFPAGFFTETPRVAVSIRSAAPGPLRISSVSTSGFQITVLGSGSGVIADWIAVQT